MPHEHLDRRRLARPVGSQEPEDFAGHNVEADVIDGREAAEPFRQLLHADYRLVLLEIQVNAGAGQAVEVGPHVGLLVAQGQQVGENIAQLLLARLRLELDRVAFEEDPALVDQGHAVAALGLVEVAGGDDHGDMLLGHQVVEDQPQVSPRDGIDAGRRLVEDQDSRVVDERAAQGQFLLHAAGELAGQPFLKVRQIGHGQELLGPPAGQRRGPRGTGRRKSRCSAGRRACRKGPGPTPGA